jgi:hypothetical protein
MRNQKMPPIAAKLELPLGYEVELFEQRVPTCM